MNVQMRIDMKRTVLMSFALSLVTGTGAVAATISESADYDEFTSQFCAAADGQHIFVVPTAVLTDQKSINCEAGASGIRIAEPADDPGHLVINVDPPDGVKSALDCDGKADVGMTLVAINCLPASMESMEHPKN